MYSLRFVVCRFMLLSALGIVGCGITLQASDWAFASKPEFPKTALKNGSEGTVTLQVVLANDGHVVSSRLIKSSGDPALDSAAQATVAKWRMNPSAIKKSDLTTGRRTVIDYRQQAIVGAAYPDRRAYFESLKDTEKFMYAPFPSYPLEDRRQHHTGTVLLKGETGPDGRVMRVEVMQSSGYPSLDRCAIAAIRLWRVHKQYAGEKFRVPIDFVMGSARRGPNW